MRTPGSCLGYRRPMGEHELVVAAEAGGAAVHTIVQVRVADVNDNAPYFLHPEPFFTVIEEDDRDLPSSITTDVSGSVKAADKDRQDTQGLLYTLSGDGVDGFSPSDAYFSINAHTGELIQQREIKKKPSSDAETARDRASETEWENLSSIREDIPTKIGVFHAGEQTTEQHVSKTSGVKRSLKKRREAKEPRKTKDTMLYNTSFDSPYFGEEKHTAGGNGGGCGDVSVFGGDRQDYHASRADWVTRGRARGGRVHLVETVVTLLVKDINDNPPVFPNTTMFGEVQENGPIGEYNFSVFGIDGGGIGWGKDGKEGRRFIVL
ncbi:Neural-cadherin [Portunus trituberculatus]|uniref:Neural-cadherin n=1 Tax=Portunus trituberculatus TaxID=210409 RepID=A0A5B7EJ04_PORTR|nr:Neural-cadherin [Portunus trituberculatus]